MFLDPSAAIAREISSKLGTYMRVSIITVAFNAAATISDTLLSVARQTYGNIEHIVIDGGSQDGTQDIAVALQRTGGLFISERDDGLYDAMNKGIARATGDVVGLLNADDMLARSDVIASIVDEFSRQPVDALLGDVKIVRPDQTDRLLRYYDSGSFRPSRLAWGIMPAHPAMYLTRNAYQRVGPYRTDYSIAADFEFIVRAFANHAISYRHIEQAFVVMRAGGISTSGLRSKFMINRECVRACRENGIYTNQAMIAAKYPRKLFERLRSEPSSIK